MNVPGDLRYSADHEWIAIDGDRAKIGITDYAQDALGDVVFVQVPEVGTTVTTGQSFSEVESTKSVSDIYAPVGGTIVEVNTSLVDAPEQVNQDPYGSGCLPRRVRTSFSAKRSPIWGPTLTMSVPTS